MLRCVNRETCFVGRSSRLHCYHKMLFIDFVLFFDQESKNDQQMFTITVEFVLMFILNELVGKTQNSIIIIHCYNSLFKTVISFKHDRSYGFIVQDLWVFWYWVFNSILFKFKFKFLIWSFQFQILIIVGKITFCIVHF